MLANKDVAANIPVKDMAKAKKFYEDTLGLKEVGHFGDEVVTLRSGKSDILVYRSEFAGTNKATALTFDVDDIESEVRDLKAKGIFFEQYDMPDMEQRGDLYVGEGAKVAWFKDPDGNILSLFEGD